MQYKAPVLSELVAEGKTPDVVFWVAVQAVSTSARNA